MGELEDLHGPARGTVDLPLHVIWSGRRSFDVDAVRPRMGLYRTVLAEGQQQDVVDFLNRELLIAQWPVLRTLISRLVRDVWEDAFPELSLLRTMTAA
ncbi:transcriptional regulator [Streptomyces luteireticuli]|uniref:transcriptional regulator n=1 Tax=Streptomyces luteireticuli TaxID=173858 RepID=UPI003557F50E